MNLQLIAVQKWFYIRIVRSIHSNLNAFPLLNLPVNWLNIETRSIKWQPTIKYRITWEFDPARIKAKHTQMHIICLQSNPYAILMDVDAIHDGHHLWVVMAKTAAGLGWK